MSDTHGVTFRPGIVTERTPRAMRAATSPLVTSLHVQRLVALAMRLGEDLTAHYLTSGAVWVKRNRDGYVVARAASPAALTRILAA